MSWGMWSRLEAMCQEGVGGQLVNKEKSTQNKMYPGLVWKHSYLTRTSQTRTSRVSLHIKRGKSPLNLYLCLTWTLSRKS
jgi:hypothetical protein